MSDAPSEPSAPSRLRELSRKRCEELLAGARLGRVAWLAADGPLVLPVNFAWYAGAVVFRTSPYGALSELTRRQPAAFEVDDIDPERRRGWSVLVRGSAEAVHNAHELADLWMADAVEPWAAGTRTLFVGIIPDSISGRELEG